MTDSAVRALKEHGQVVPLMAGVLVLVALLALGVAGIGAQAVSRARAQNAADAAALAAALHLDPTDAHDVAATVVRRNDAELVEVHRVGTVVVVHVRMGSHDAIAAASPMGDASVDSS